MKKLLNSIPLSRLVIYLVVLALLPLFFVGYVYTKSKNEWDLVAAKITSVHTLSSQKAQKQFLNSIVRKKYSQADAFYLDNQLESLTFLKKEHEALKNLLQNPSFTGNEQAEKRYAFLNGKGNRLKFIEHESEAGEGIQETTVALDHSVEVDAHDLETLLTQIEEEHSGKPQLLITDFKLNKKAQPNGNEVFELNLNLLKREFVE